MIDPRRTVGVEEEMLLVRPADGVPVPAADALVRDVEARGDVHGEFKQEQVEINSLPWASMDDLAADLVRLRARLVGVAARHGLAVAASGTSAHPGRPTAVRGERFDRIRREFTALATGQLTCGTHVHVGVSSRDEGVAVLDRIRPWLSLLTAMTASSPFWQGQDTGYASYRSVVLSQLPTAGPTPLWGDVGAYDRTVAEIVATGAAFDAAMIYFDARLSARYPTVEIRVADACQVVEEPVLLAALCRGLVDTAAKEWRCGLPPPDVPVGVLRGAAWRAARHGMTGELYAPARRLPVPAWEAVDDLLVHIEPVLTVNGDLELVHQSAQQLRQRGTGAERQRAAWRRTGSLEGLLEATVLRTARTRAEV